MFARFLRYRLSVPMDQRNYKKVSGLLSPSLGGSRLMLKNRVAIQYSVATVALRFLSKRIFRSAAR